jgi:outer membrane protein assembly factor BamE (lipoprotein component of BamABCDE complex)
MTLGAQAAGAMLAALITTARRSVATDGVQGTGQVVARALASQLRTATDRDQARELLRAIADSL